MYNEQFFLNLKAQRANFIEQIKHIDAMLKLNGIELTEEISYVNEVSESNNNNLPYKKSSNYQGKIAGLLKKYNRFLSIYEMAVLVAHYEPNILLEEAKKGLGSAKNLLLKDGTIVKHQVGTNNSNSFYGSPNWLNEDGTIKEDHKYNEDALLIKQKIEI